MQLEGQGRSLICSFTRHILISNPAAIEQYQNGGDKQKRQESARATGKRAGWNCRVLHRLGLP